MTRRVGLVALIALAAAAWFVAGSYAFVFLVGLRDWYINHASPIDEFYQRLLAGGYHPAIALWTYLLPADPHVRSLWFGGLGLPVVPAGLIALLGWRITQFRRLRPRLVRYPWEGDNPAHPTDAA